MLVGAFKFKYLSIWAIIFREIHKIKSANFQNQHFLGAANRTRGVNTRPTHFVLFDFNFHSARRSFLTATAEYEFRFESVFLLNKKSANFQNQHFLGAANRTRTGDLVLTKDVLYHLSHSSKNGRGRRT